MDFSEDLHVDPARGGRVWLYDARTSPTMRHTHRHDELEVNLLVRGWVDYLIGDRRIRFPSGSLGWLFPHQNHRLIHRAADVQMWIAVFAPDLIGELGATQAGPPPEWPERATDQNRMIGRAGTDLATLCGRVTNSGSSPYRYRTGLSWLLSECWQVYRDARSAPESTPLHPAVQTAARWLHDHADQPDADDLDGLARRCGISRPWLSKLFHDQLGESLTDYRNRQRLERFSELLARSRAPSMTDAALAAGFGSYAQCYRVVREHTGLTPRDLVRRLNPSLG